VKRIIPAFLAAAFIFGISGPAAKAEPGVTIVQTVVPLSAGVDTRLVEANTHRRYLGFMNTGTGAATLAFGGTAAVNGSGWVIDQASAAGRQGGSMVWESSAIASGEVHAISQIGTTIVVLEGL
jgi:hypothetical protein